MDVVRWRHLPRNHARVLGVIDNADKAHIARMRSGPNTLSPELKANRDNRLMRCLKTVAD